MKPTNLSHPRAFARVAVPAALLALGACGGSSGPGPTPVTLPPTPAVAITATPAGNLVLHPSLDTRFTFALETPIRLQETAGGSADWNFVRMQVFLRGREIERYELGATSIASQGYTKITPNSKTCTPRSCG